MRRQPSEVPPVELRPWSDGDLWLLRELNAPEMTEHIGGPESEEKVLARHRRYAGGGETGTDRMFVIQEGPSAVPVGSIGYWQRRWNGEDVYETGWSILPAHQGRGLGTTAARLLVRHVAEHGNRRWLHAFPSVGNEPSNAICRKAGFELVGPCDFEYPPGHPLRVNDWRCDVLALTAEDRAAGR